MDSTSEIVTNSLDLFEKAADSFQDVCHSLEESSTQSQTISDSAEEQTADKNEVGKIAQNIIVTAEETAAGSEQIESSSTELFARMESHN